MGSFINSILRLVEEGKIDSAKAAELIRYANPCVSLIIF
jgi:hypothetical protein